MVVKKFKKHILLTTILLLIIVFITGLLLGRSLSNAEMDDLQRFIQENELNTESFLIEQELMGSFEDNCELSNARLNDLFSEQVEIGRLLNVRDAKKRLGEDNFRLLKKKYHLMQARTYIMFKRVIDNCKPESHIILYYYGSDDEDSKLQGEILDRVVKDYGTTVLAIEYNYSKELEFLEESYQIKETPSVIIDYETMLEGLSYYDEITPYLSKQ